MNKLLVIGLIVLSLVLIGCKNEDVTGAVVLQEGCQDSDGGINKGTQGVVTLEDEDYSDDCVAGILIEYYCDGDNVANQNIRCKDKCNGGKCV